MDWIAGKEKALEFLKKYKYVALVLVLGMLLMLIPESSGSKQEQAQEPTPIQTVLSESDEERLAKILSQIDGAGKVQVLLTVGRGAETIYQTDDETVTGAGSGTVRIETVIISNGDREENGMVRQVNPPTYLGAIIVCQGGDRAAVRLAITDAVSKVTGLGSDRISVLKMK